MILDTLAKLLDKIVTFVQDNWSGFAAMFWQYEDGKIQSQKIETDKAQLDGELKQNELDENKKINGLSDADVIRKFTDGDGTRSDSNGSGAPPKV